MNYSELLKEVKTVPYKELRNDTPELLELVIIKDALNQVSGILEHHFGKPLKPAGVDSSQEAKQVADSLGGIRRDQTLYYLEQGGMSHCAMLWPWGNGISITLKVFQSAR